jgi:hypothetical protein
MPKKPLVWKAEPGTTLDSAFSAQSRLGSASTLTSLCLTDHGL